MSDHFNERDSEKCDAGESNRGPNCYLYIRRDVSGAGEGERVKSKETKREAVM